MEVCKDKELCHLQRLCTSSPKPSAQKLIQAHLKQMSDLNDSVKLNTSLYAACTPLHFLAMSTCIDENETVKLMEWLINHGAHVNAQNANGSTVVHVAAEEGKKIVLEFLFSCEKLFMKAVNNKGVSYLHIACMLSNAKTAQRILNSRCMEIMNNQMNFSNFPTKDRWILGRIYSGGETAMHVAVLNNSLDIVQLLIDHRVDLNRKDDKGSTPLWHATKNNFLKIQWVLQQAISVHSTENHKETYENSKNLPESCKVMHVANSNIFIKGFTDLHRMCMENNVLEIKKLLKQKVDVDKSISKDSPSWCGYTALHIAVKQGNSKIVQLLLNHSADVNAKDGKGMSPLHLAIEEKRWNISELLINHGADLWATDMKGMNPLHFAISKYGELTELDKKIIDCYVADFFQSKDEKFIDNLGISLLYIACIINDPSIVMHSLQKKVAVDSRIKFSSPLFPGYTPLHLAVKFENFEVVQVLLDNCADYTLMNADGLTPLHLAQKLGNFGIVESIFSNSYFRAGNPISSDGISHFHIACMRNKIEAVKKYIEHNVDVNQPIDFFAENKFSGRTPLHIAVIQCCTELIEVLLNHKDIMINAVDSFGSSPLHCACHGTLCTSPETEIVELLLKHAADPNAEDLFGRRPIEIAIKQDNEMLLGMLLKYKVDLNYFNIVNSFNPLLAVISSTTLNYQMFKMLLDNGADVTVRNENKSTIMHKVVCKSLINLKRNYKVGTAGLSQIISCLCWKGCDIDSRDDRGRTPLHVAIQNCNVDGAWALLKNGVDINIKDDLEKIPVQYYRQYRLTINYHFNHYFMYHILKLKMSNLYIDQKNDEWYLQMKAFYKKDNQNIYAMSLLQELEVMKQCKLSSYTTLRDILHKTPNEMVTLIENKMLKRSIHLSSKFTATFLEYSNLLLAKYNKGVIWKSLIQPAKDSLTELLDGPEWPDACFEGIFKFLTIDDMRGLIKSRCVSEH